MGGISVPTPNSVPGSVIALAGLFFVVAVILAAAIELITFTGNLLFDVDITGILMAIWFGIVVYFVWSTR